MSPRASRRRVVTIEDDEDDEAHSRHVDDKPSKAQTRGSARAKPIADEKAHAKIPSNKASLSTSSQKSKSKSTINAPVDKEPSKPNGKPIYSFFNAVTQRQKTNQLASSSEKLSALHEDVEAIHDDLDDDEPTTQRASQTTLSKGSSTALAMRKRKFQRTQSFEDESAVPSAPTASQKFRKTSNGERAVYSLTVVNEDKRPWTEQFAPNDLSELAVHKRKVSDVRNWLEMAYKGRRGKVLVLKGAAGSGKTTTFQLLAKDFGIKVIEWKDSATSDRSSEQFVSASTRFEEFVARAGKSSGLTLSNGNDEVPKCQPPSYVEREESAQGLQALLVEEFPNTFAKTSVALQSFRTTVLQYLSSPTLDSGIPIPMVMIISETLLSTNTAAADSFTAHRLLGPELIANPSVNTIEFNPIAPTILTKALEAIVVKEARKSGRRRTPGPQVVKHLAEIGDIRSAVSTLEFLCLRGDDDDTWSSKISFTKTKQSKAQPPLTKSEEEALKLICNRENSIGIFHSVGKVVYNKRTEPAAGRDLAQLPIWLSHHRRDRIPETNADSLIDELGTDISTYLAALHENYALSCSCASPESSLECLTGCMDNLSDSDLLSLDRLSFGARAFSGSAADGLRQDELCFQVGVRGMLFSLPSTVHRSAGISGNRGEAYRMYYPASLKLWKRKEEVEDSLHLVIARLASSNGLGGAKHGSREAASGNGIESWKRNKAMAAKPDSSDHATDTVTPTASSEARNEMLLDRLPYLAHILDGGNGSAASQTTLEQVLSVTRISGTAQLDENEPDGEEDEDANTMAEAWATDRPDVDAVSSSPKKRLVPSNKKQLFEAMSIPVETRVEKLVLEDDDIVDD